MHELNEADREAILMRYFQNRPHAEIGEQIGLSESAARMRVERALEKLRAVLSRRGVRTTAALSAALAANAVAIAPTGLAATITMASVLAGTTTAATTAAALTKAIAMTSLQKAIIGVVLAAAVGTGIFEARQVSILRSQVHSLQEQQVPMTHPIERRIPTQDDAARQLVALREENERLKQNASELLRLRGEVGLLRKAAQDSKQAETDPIQLTAKSWAAKVDVLKQWLEQSPEQQIPELNAYFKKHMNEALLKSYKLLHTGKLADVPKNEFLVAEISPPFDASDDMHFVIRIGDWRRTRRVK